MLKTIETHNGHLIQKITKSNGDLVRYQTLHSVDKGDASKITPHTTLTAARKHLGIAIKAAETALTLPKSAYPQNAKGYRADNQARKG